MVDRYPHVDAGFSLIECIVVVALLGVLLSLFLPALSHVRRLAEQTQCQANQRQRNILWASVATETARIPFPHEWQLWIRDQMPGSKEVDKIDVCPSFLRLFPSTSTVFMRSHYALNDRWFPQGSGGPPASGGQPWEGVLSPSRYIWFADIGDFTTLGLPAYEHFGWVPIPPIPVIPMMPVDEATLGVGFHHLGEQSTIAYADGSCRLLKRDQFLVEGSVAETFQFGPFMLPMNVPRALYNR